MKPWRATGTRAGAGAAGGIETVANARPLVVSCFTRHGKEAV